MSSGPLGRWLRFSVVGLYVELMIQAIDGWPLALCNVLQPARHFWRVLPPGAERLNRTGADIVRCKGGHFQEPVHRSGDEQVIYLYE